MQMIVCHPRHPNHLSQDPDSISRTFLEQFVLVLTCICTDKHDRWGRFASPGGNRIDIRHNIVYQFLRLQIKGEQRVEEHREVSQLHEVDYF